MPCAAESSTSSLLKLSERSGSVSGPRTVVSASSPGGGFARTDHPRRSAVSPERIETEVDGRRLSLSNLDKVLYPETGFTKGEMIDYYARIAEVMVPHVEDRAITF